MPLTAYQASYYAHELTRQCAVDSVDKLAAALTDAQVDLNPHQVEAALFACQNPLSRGVILADEVGLGKTIEAGLVLAQYWAERKRKILIIVPANLRKQWHQELLDKFALDSLILEAKSYNQLKKNGSANPFVELRRPVICSYQFAKAKIADVRIVPWDMVVFDEAHRLRNVYKPSNVIANTLKVGLAGVPSKVLMTATPLQNSLLELYGLVSIIDDRVFGDLDSFRQQFATLNQEDTFQRLRNRIAPLCKRTLRWQVAHTIAYTKRIPIVQEFRPSDDEQLLRTLVADYLRRPDLKALPNSQRQLITLVLWKLLASSTHAIGGALGTMVTRLEKILQQDVSTPDLVEVLDEDYEGLDEDTEEWEAESPEILLAEQDRANIRNEIIELRRYETMATSIRDNAKGQALLIALNKAFTELDRLGAPRKALIFTESRRTQEYLLSLLKETSYGDGIVLFNGTNSGKEAQQIYQAWLAKHEDSDRITGSKTADTRAALVEHFRDHGKVMIATEAGAEGINLQFCSLVINYDLPWNPQRVEQRIGRCHRYGQKFDVVVVNFVDLSNEADRRVYELLDQKFQLFSGVFGASDEVLGTIGSGVDFERRIAEIYQHCRDPQTIHESFQQLQLDLAGEINEAMVRTRDILLEHFDEKVLDKIKTSSIETRDRYERMFMDLTRFELSAYANFDSDGAFVLSHLPSEVSKDKVPLGRYELPRRSGEAHLYRLGHPLGEFVLEQAKARPLSPAKLIFDYNTYGKRITTLEPLRGTSGWLALELLTVDSLGGKEQHLVVSAITKDGYILPEDDPEKLLRLPVREQLQLEATPNNHTLLHADLMQRKNRLTEHINRRNLKYFEQEVQKLDAWADDLKVGLENEIKEFDRQIKEVRRTAATAPTLEEKLHWQKQQREIEQRRNKLRRELFDRQDQVEAKRNGLIAELESQLKQKSENKQLFVIEWELV
ncbi:SNF2-related protein [Nitrosomonas communis]|uniref:SNF2-related protein n=1 Tax=Nitrosomonas communis TaxID=44574 RepID=UPI0026EED6DB|nr:SNF2-related protein [Nitrosomonas communis]MCO6428346.1 DEAD/DEAH box helicase [Nitrosomonas communis]